MTTTAKLPAKLYTREFAPTPKGYVQWKVANHRKKFSNATWMKWRPTILRVEALRTEHFGSTPWSAIDEKDLGQGFWKFRDQLDVGAIAKPEVRVGVDVGHRHRNRERAGLDCIAPQVEQLAVILDDPSRQRIGELTGHGE